MKDKGSPRLPRRPERMPTGGMTNRNRPVQCLGVGGGSQSLPPTRLPGVVGPHPRRRLRPHPVLTPSQEWPAGTPPFQANSFPPGAEGARHGFELIDNDNLLLAASRVRESSRGCCSSPGIRSTRIHEWRPSRSSVLFSGRALKRYASEPNQRIDPSLVSLATLHLASPPCHFVQPGARCELSGHHQKPALFPKQSLHRRAI